MSYYIAGESTKLGQGKLKGKLKVIGGQTIPVQCLIINDLEESAVVGLDDWAPLIDVLENLVKDTPRQVGRPLNGLYLVVQYKRAIGKLQLRNEVVITVSREDYTDSWSVALGMEDVATLIGLLKGAGPY
jgi:hypothetical protein